MFFPYPCLVSSSIEQKLHQKYVRLPSSSVPVFRQKGFLFHLETLARKLDFLIIHCNTLLGLIYLLFSIFVINAIIIFSLIQENVTIKYTIRSIVCEASCHPVIQSSGHLVIRSSGHLFIRLSGHPVIRSFWSSWSSRSSFH